MRRIFSGMKSSTTWLGNVIAQSPSKKCLSSELFQRFIMVYRSIIGVNFHLFIICYDWWCHFPFLKKTFHHNGSAFLGEMCRSSSLVVNTSLEAPKLRLRQHRLSCRLNRLNKQSRWEEWQDKVSFCSLICFNWRVPARVSFVLARTLGARSHSGRLLTHYHPREARNSIYRYRKIHIDYRSKFSYRFISSISIIYGNTTQNHEYLDCFTGLTVSWSPSSAHTYIPRLFHGPDCVTVSTRCTYTDLGTAEGISAFTVALVWFIATWPKQQYHKTWFYDLGC